MAPSKLPTEVDPSFAPLLQGYLDYFYNPDMAQSDNYAHLEPQDTPLTFYDRHISSTLLCKRVAGFPTMVPVLSKTCDDALAKFYAQGRQLSPNGYTRVYHRRRYPIVFEKSQTIGQHFERYIGRPTGAYATKLYINPYNTAWVSAFVFERQFEDYNTSNFVSEWKLKLYYGDAELFEKLVDGMPEEKVQHFNALYERFPFFALWHFYPMTAAGKSVVRNMLPQQSFVWECARTSGYKNVSLTPPPSDAPSGILYRRKKPHTIRSNTSSRGKFTKRRPVGDNLESENSSKPDFMQKRSAIVNIHRQGTRTFRRRVADAQQFIQHAWARAVINDTTFIIFSCGQYERIGVRHRTSQTLYLSPPIDPVNSRNPSYGKLNLGLYSAIAQDVLERLELEKDSALTNGKKRSAEHLEDQDATRKKKKVRKTTPSLCESGYEKVKEEIGKRELVLMTLNYDIYCSPVPATFLRITASCAPGSSGDFYPTSRTRFRPVEYIDLTLSEPVGRGAVGVVHPATISMELEGGQVLEHKVIVKLAFSRSQKIKLKHEYEVYVHLLKVGNVSCILDVHGLFEDPDSNTLALVMEDGGRSLAHLNELEEDREDKVLGKDRTACINALKSIHAAGVRHRDIRPHNILFDDKGRVSIIDFDCSTFEPFQNSKAKFEDELRRLEAVLDGDYADGVWDS